MFNKLAAWQYVNYVSKTSDLLSVRELDKIHKIAVENYIVSPFSSMIALVSEWQEEELEKNSQGADRFDTEMSDDGEKFRAPQRNSGLNLFVGGVPEPEEWLLIILSVIMVTYFYRDRLLKFWMEKIPPKI